MRQTPLIELPQIDLPMKLTDFSHGGGCACKVGPADLEHVLGQLPIPNDPRLLASFATGGEAVVYQVGPDTAMVISVDYMTPVVNDPYAFGAIAAANALSDIYAMGAQPVLALSVAGFATKTLPISLLEAIIRGGSDKVREAGAWIAGGHSIDDYEPKYGLVVVGIAKPQDLVHSHTARAGDKLVLTKAIGHGALATGIDRGMASQAGIATVTAAMSQLNRGAAEAMVRVGATACSDVGGFGLLGQLHSMAKASGVEAVVDASAVPILPEAREMVQQGAIPSGTRNNQHYYDRYVEWDPGIDGDLRVLMHDAQPSGGLLMTVAPERSAHLLEALHDAGAGAALIGEMAAGHAGQVRVVTDRH